MATRPDEIALGLVGAPFRLHGRAAATGLDCVGLAGLAYGLEGLPSGYSVRTCGEVLARAIGRHGLRRVEEARPGDLLLLRPGPAQGHLAIKTLGGFVHAHAGLAFVVETPGVPEWPVLGIYRKD